MRRKKVPLKPPVAAVASSQARGTGLPVPSGPQEASVATGPTARGQPGAPAPADTAARGRRPRTTGSLSSIGGPESEVGSGAVSAGPRAQSLSTSCSLVACAGLRSSEVHLPPSVMARLGVVSGMVVGVTDGTVRMFAEVFLGPSMKGSTAKVADEMAAAFDRPTVDLICVSAEVLTAAVGRCVRSVVVRLSMDAKEDIDAVLGGTAHVGGPVPPAPYLAEAPALRARAAATFRREYRHRLVFVGMVATLRIATQLVFAEVVSLRGAGDAGPPPDAAGAHADASRFTLLRDSTTIVVTLRPDGAEEGTEEEPQRPSATAAASDAMEGAAAEEGAAIDGAASSACVVVVGDTGTGKSRWLRREAERERAASKRTIIDVRVEDLPQGESSEVTAAVALHERFVEARSSAPSLVVIDDLHLVCGREATSIGSRWVMAQLAAVLARELDVVATLGGAVRVIAAAPSTDSLDSALLTAGRLGQRVVPLAPPNSAAERLACLRAILSERPPGSGSVADATLAMVAAESHGFSQRDLAKVVAAAGSVAFRATGSAVFSDEHVLAAAKSVRPSILRMFEVAVPPVSWADIGGSEEAKETLRECVAWCLGKQRWVFDLFKLTPPRGVLLFGPPGCSKTMLAKALANESKMNFISVKGPEVFSKWVGDSEKAVRDIFERARAAAPCVVFIDELDGMCTHRGGGGVTDRVISQFLTELDGLPAAFSQKSDAVILVAATNRPDNIDAAVLRPGRIDRKVYVGLPALGEREAIAQIHFQRMPVEAALTARYVAEATEGYTGAEVVAVCKEAAFHAIMADLAAKHVTRGDVDAALHKVRPRISATDIDWYKHWSQGI